jgi:ribosomal protein L44E
MRNTGQDARPFVAGRAAQMVDTMLRQRCTRCGGWLYVEPGKLPDGSIELSCMMCGNRQYVTRGRRVVGRREPRRWERMEQRAS